MAVPRVVFHCALSQVRGPTAAKAYAKELERRASAKEAARARTAAPKDPSVNEAATFSLPNPFDNQDLGQEVLVLREGFTGWQGLYRVRRVASCVRCQLLTRTRRTILNWWRSGIRMFGVATLNRHTATFKLHVISKRALCCNRVPSNHREVAEGTTMHYSRIVKLFLPLLLRTATCSLVTLSLATCHGAHSKLWGKWKGRTDILRARIVHVCRMAAGLPY